MCVLYLESRRVRRDTLERSWLSLFAPRQLHIHIQNRQIYAPNRVISYKEHEHVYQMLMRRITGSSLKGNSQLCAFP